MPAPPQVGRVDRRSNGIQLHEEAVVGTTPEGRLEGPGGCREVRRTGPPCDIGVAGGIHGEASTLVQATSTYVGGVHERGSGGVQLRHVGVVDTTEGRLEGPGGCREVRRTDPPCDIGVAGGIYGQTVDSFGAASTYVGGVHERGSGGVQLRHEDIGATIGRRLEGPWCRREVRGEVRRGDACHISIAGSVHRDVSTAFSPTSPEVGGVDERGAGGVQLRHEAIHRTTTEGCLERTRGCRKARPSGARDIGIARGVQGDRQGLRPGNISRIDWGTNGVQFGHKGIA